MEFHGTNASLEKTLNGTVIYTNERAEKEKKKSSLLQ